MLIALLATSAIAAAALVAAAGGWARHRAGRRALRRVEAAARDADERAQSLRSRIKTLRAGEREAAWAAATASLRRIRLTDRYDEAVVDLRRAEERRVALETRVDALREVLSESERNLAESHAALEEAQRRITALEARAQAAEHRTEEGPELKRLREVEERLVAREAALTDLRSRLDAVTRAKESEARRLEARIRELERLHAEIERRDHQIEDLETAIKEAEEARQRAEDEVQELDIELSRLRSTAGAASKLEDELRGLKHALRSERERNARLVRRAKLGGPGRGSTMVGDDAEVRRLTARLARLEAALEESARAERVDPDDLQAIKGIGPKIAEILASLGVTSLHDIAELTAADVDRIGRHLPVYGGRIRDDRWVEQAKELLAVE